MLNQGSNQPNNWLDGIDLTGKALSFSEAWRLHRRDSLKLHDEVLFPEILKLLSASVAKPDSLVDAGCGDGALTVRAIETLLPKQVIAIDNDSKLLSQSRARCGCYADHRLSDIGSGLNLPASTVDALICSNVLMHLNEQQQRYFLKSVAQCLTPRGHAVIAVTHEDWVRKDLRFLPDDTFPAGECKDWNGTKVWQLYHDGKGYKKLFHYSGLEVVGRSELAIPRMAGLSSRYSERAGDLIYDVYLLKALKQSSTQPCH